MTKRITDKYRINAINDVVFDADGEEVNCEARETTLGCGLKTGTGWVKADEEVNGVARETTLGCALLVYDRNGNGTIDDGSEFFGEEVNCVARETALGCQTMVDGVRATDGFAALSAEDTNNDGVFDANDANFMNVRVWQDKNQDGISQSDELRTLSEAGTPQGGLSCFAIHLLASISLIHRPSNNLNFNNTRRAG